MEAKIRDLPTGAAFTANESTAIDLDAHPDGTLLRLCRLVSHLRAHAAELEKVVASLPAITAEGKVVKKLIAYRQQHPCEA